MNALYPKQLHPVKTLKTYLQRLAAMALVALAGFTGSVLAATTINVNFGSDPGDAVNGKTFMYDSGSRLCQQAPASYTGTTWNDYLSTNSGAVTVVNMLDSDGHATTVGYTTVPTTTPYFFDGPLTWSDHPQVKLLNGGLRRAGIQAVATCCTTASRSADSTRAKRTISIWRAPKPPT